MEESVNKSVEQEPMINKSFMPDNKRNIYILSGVLVVILFVGAGIIYAMSSTSGTVAPTISQNTTTVSSGGNTTNPNKTQAQVSAIPSLPGNSGSSNTGAAPSNATGAATQLNNLEQQMNTNSSAESTDYNSMKNDMSNGNNDTSDNNASSQL